ncbi:MAG: hypothetical protein COA78_05925 [Blastopirellula sp.]|nr:MAG: hypothetical protein COA78_05925 [Blastopirellula sp.]
MFKLSCCLFVFLSLATLQVQAEDKLGEAELKIFWKSILEKKIDDDSLTIPERMSFEASIAFEDYLKNRSLQNKRFLFKYFVDQFGEHGPDADFKWMMAWPDGTLPSVGYKSYSPLKEKPLLNDPAFINQSGHEYLCEFIVKRAEIDNKFLKRYYEMTIWNPLLFGFVDRPSSSIPMLSVSFRKIHERCTTNLNHLEWSYIRSYVLLTYAFGREDLLQENLDKSYKERFEIFHKWFQENQPYFKADNKRYRWVLDEEAKQNKKVLNKSNGLPKLVPPKKPFSNWKHGDLPANFPIKFMF